jgi:hypothetical protein
MEDVSASGKEDKKNLPRAFIGTMIFILITSGVLLVLLKCGNDENGLSSEKPPSVRPALEEMSKTIQTLDKKIDTLSAKFKDLGPDHTLHSHPTGNLSWQEDLTIDYLKNWPQQNYNIEEWEAMLEELKGVTDLLVKASQIEKVHPKSNYTIIYVFYIIITVLTLAGNTTIAISFMKEIDMESKELRFYQKMLTFSAASLFIALVMQLLGLLANQGSTPLFDEKLNIFCLLISIIFFLLSFAFAYRYIIRRWKYSNY